MFNKTITSIFAYIILISTLSAQQTSEYKFNNQDQFINNPSAISPMGSNIFSGYYFRQFTAIQRAPTDMYVAGQVVFKDQNLGIGSALIRESAGAVYQTRLNLSASYRLREILSGDDYISLGIGATASQLSISSADIRVTDKDDPFFFMMNQNAININTSVGVLYSSRSEIKSRYNSPLIQLGAAYNRSLPQVTNFTDLSYQETSYLHGLARVIVPYSDHSHFSVLLESVYESMELLNLNLTMQALLNSTIIVGGSVDKDLAVGIQVGYRHNSYYGSKAWQIELNTISPLGSSGQVINTGFGVRFAYEMFK